MHINNRFTPYQSICALSALSTPSALYCEGGLSLHYTLSKMHRGGRRALGLYCRPPVWQKMRRTGEGEETTCVLGPCCALPQPAWRGRALCGLSRSRRRAGPSPEQQRAAASASSGRQGEEARSPRSRPCRPGPPDGRGLARAPASVGTGGGAGSLRDFCGRPVSRSFHNHPHLVFCHLITTLIWGFWSKVA